MHTTRAALAAVLLAVTLGCQETGSASLETDDQKASYGIGLTMGRQLQPASSHVDMAALRAGIEDALAEREPRIASEDLQSIMKTFNETIRAEMQVESEASAQKNTEEGEAYLAENGAKEGVTTTESGLQFEVLREGEGRHPTTADRVTIHYRGTLIDGTEFDSSYERDTPATFGVSGVIPGFSEGLQLMTVGSKYRLVIPGELAYGATGSPPKIGPNATLIFEIELLEIPGS